MVVRFLGLGAIYMLRETFYTFGKNNSVEKSSPETLPFFRECVSIFVSIVALYCSNNAPEAKVCEKGIEKFTVVVRFLGLGAIYMLRETFIILEKNNSVEKSSPETLPFFSWECVSILYPLSRCVARISAPEAKVCEKGIEKFIVVCHLGRYMLVFTFFN